MNSGNYFSDPQISVSEKTLPIIEQIADQMPGGFFIYRADETEELLYINSAMLDIFGCDTEEEFKELTGNSFKGIVHPDDLEEVEKSISKQISENRSRLDYVEYRIIRKDGDIRYVDDYGHFVSTEDYGDLYYVFINDTTEKHISQELERAQRLHKMKVDFLFSISHDIRTPMNSIMGFTALARSHINEPEILAEYLEKVDISNHHMIALIDDILEMTGIENGTFGLQPEICSLTEEIANSLNLIEITAKQKSIAIETDIVLPKELVYLDAGKFSRVMSNILTNAVKFTPPKGTVKIAASKKESSLSGYARYEISVSDNGIGISKEFLPHLFEPFEREETSTKTGYPGAGLGMSIARSLVDMMGGTISAESEKGSGSVFTVSVPLKIAETEDSGKSSGDENVGFQFTSGEGKRVLVVEDIEINRILAETVLDEFGFEVESVPDGCYAVDAVRDHEEGYYDLILMDIQMPVMNGYEATKAIRALDMKYVSSLPIIALSANANANDKRMSVESGMNTHIAKPFETDNLIKTISRYL